MEEEMADEFARTSGNWGGFSLEIETYRLFATRQRMAQVATGAASRLRLKQCERAIGSPGGDGGNWGGFSFEIETFTFSSISAIIS